MWFLILLVIVGVCALAYKNRVTLLAKMLGQSETPSTASSSASADPAMRFRESINVTLDGAATTAPSADQELHRHATETLGRADALLFGG